MKLTPEIDAILAEALAEQIAPIPALEFDPADLECDLANMGLDIALDPSHDVISLDPSTSAPSVRPKPTPARAGSTKISIRVPAWVMAAFQDRAEASGKGYQKLMNEVLGAAARGWSHI